MIIFLINKIAKIFELAIVLYVLICPPVDIS